MTYGVRVGEKTPGGGAGKGPIPSHPKGPTRPKDKVAARPAPPAAPAARPNPMDHPGNRRAKAAREAARGGPPPAGPSAPGAARSSPMRQAMGNIASRGIR